MAYSTIEDLTRSIDDGTLVNLASDNEEATLNSEDVQAVLNEAIESADAVIDMHVLPRDPDLRTKDPVPPWVNFASCQIALYNLHNTKGRMPPARQKTFDFWMEYLEKINRGDLVLVDDSEGTTQAEPYNKIRTDATNEDDDDTPSNDRRVYTHAKLAKL